MNMKQKRGFDQNDRIYELLCLLFTNSLQVVCLIMIYNRMGWSCDQYQEMEKQNPGFILSTMIYIFEHG